ncbi:VOC family protein [Planctomicrobium sp. SH664]|uniref:VOC family protein n=1 Tax=Planctomicrobium sp. SH664 TaxID=3448125 RepID=UPI003F5B8E69
MSVPPIRVRQIDHITIVVRDLEASRRFYCDLLGMQQVPRPAFPFAGLWFQAGVTLLHLILEHPESPYYPAVGVTSNSRGRHFAFAVDDIQEVKAKLDELGVGIVNGPKQRPDGPTQLYILDPDDNLIELFG